MAHIQSAELYSVLKLETSCFFKSQSRTILESPSRFSDGTGRETILSPVTPRERPLSQSRGRSKWTLQGDMINTTALEGTIRAAYIKDCCSVVKL